MIFQFNYINLLYSWAKDKGITLVRYVGLTVTIKLVVVIYIYNGMEFLESTISEHLHMALLIRNRIVLFLPQFRYMGR